MHVFISVALLLRKVKAFVRAPRACVRARKSRENRRGAEFPTFDLSPRARRRVDVRAYVGVPDHDTEGT